MYLLFDCNNFFASCEQVFRPDWRRRPLVVLSNNDGCVISRSAEAKAAGIAMGEPYFKCKDRLERMNAVVCSANFALYSDLSDRFISILEQELPEVQQYSIDEAFAVVEPGVDWKAVARRLRSKIRRWTGITVSVGIAPTRTLCKLANETAKHHPQTQGVLALNTPEDWEPLLQQTPVGDIWGVGRRLLPRMHALGIRTAAGVAAADKGWLRKQFGVHGERMGLELNGIPCIDEEPAAPRSQVMVSRSLKEAVTELPKLREILCLFVEKAGRILRQEGMMASGVHVVLRTSRYEETQLYANSASLALGMHTDDNREFATAACRLLEEIYRPGYPYRKIGVLLTELLPQECVQPTFEHPDTAPSALMDVLDKLQKAGHNVHFANRAANTPWKREFTSPCYTTCWDDIPEAH
ncbi:MAG: Y-family DNA polymerase [Akkermansiaceae bacterium]|nr:Y-family DNA polymerase [Akkermansiaceae bacterium]